MTDTHSSQLHVDDRRAHELYQYFQPDNPAILSRNPSYTAPGSSNQSHGSLCSPNIVLTAIAQLAAMKLGVQRAIIRYLAKPCIY